MPDPVHLKLDRFRHVVADEFETRVADPTRNVGLASCEVIVQADHFIPSLHEAINQVGAKETGTASDEVDRHPQWVKSLSTIPDTGASATVDSSA